MKQENESIMDQPVEGMCREVWDIPEDGTPTMNDEARAKIQNIVDWIVEKFDLVNHSVNVTGSITSNSYTKTSDIDVHMSSPVINEQNADEMNRQLRKEYAECFENSFSGSDRIGEHPIEVYFQVNPIQDMMSIGCYDFVNDKWVVGPDMKDLSFDPYMEYYDDDMEFLDGILSEVRDNIFKVYELCEVIDKSKDQRFKAERTSELMVELGKASDLFDTITNNRKLSSSPKTREEALKLRNSPKWKRADSSFKLMVDFGYIPILKVLKTANNDLKENPELLPDVVDRISSSFNIEGNTQTSTRKLAEEDCKDFPKDGDKIVFVNVDGVLCPRKSKYQQDAAACSMLKNICDRLGAKIVWTTSWGVDGPFKRKFRGTQYYNPMKSISETLGGCLCEDDPCLPDPETPSVNNKNFYRSMMKSGGILDWLERHKGKVSNFAVVDSADFMNGNLRHVFGDRFVKTSPGNGFDPEAAQALISVFSGNGDEMDWDGFKRFFRVEDDFENANFILPDGCMIGLDGDGDLNRYFNLPSYDEAVEKMISSGAVKIRLLDSPEIKVGN